MPVCPRCGGSKVSTKGVAKASLVIDGKEKNGEGDAYICDNCNAEFTLLKAGRTQLYILAEPEVRKIVLDSARLKNRNSQLSSRYAEASQQVRSLRRSLKTLKEESGIRQLEAKRNELQSQIEYLAKEKSELELRLKKLSQG
ncbi:MAG: hypothetical protein QXR69_00595 [Conexivisphaerales archaeon]